MTKKINIYSLFYGSIIFIFIIIVESLIKWQLSFSYSLAFVIGLFTGVINLIITDKSLKRIEYNDISKPRIFYGSVAVLKYIIYGVAIYASTCIFGLYTAFLCALGMLFNKIIIYYINLIKIPREDKKRLVDHLDLPKDIIQKLKYNDFFKVLDITEVNREKLLTFLTEIEVEKVIKSLKKYELFIKGELEAIIENDENVDV